jgi:hypothetical protein
MHSLLAAVCLAGAGMAQSGTSQSGPSTFSVIDEAQAPPALVRSVRVVSGQDGPAVEIITTRPMIPVITRLADPARLVIDLPKSYLSERQRIAFLSKEISRIRIDQFQKNPPIVRLVVDLSKPCGFGWDAAGNRLMIRLHPEQANPAQPSPAPSPAGPVFTRGVAPASAAEGGVISGTVIPASSHLGTSSSVTAGGDTAVVKLERGGEVRVCPGTTVSVTSSQNGRDLMLGISTGALEAHYRLDASADSVLTPDFRILLPGPGKFDYAISADSRGNTCVRALPGNTASALVSELMGDGVYQVKPSEQVVFHAGQLATLDANVPADCGCPTPSVPVMRVAAPPPPTNSEVAQTEAAPAPAPPAAAASVALPATAAALQVAGAAPSGEAPAIASATPETVSLPASQPNEVHVQVDAPLVFRASDPQPHPSLAVEATRPSLSDSGHPQPPTVAVLPPPADPPEPEATARPPHRGFFGKVKRVLAAIFR